MQGYDALLKKYVSDGRADYKGLAADSDALERYLDRATGGRKAQLDGWTESERLAFLINLYNAATMKRSADNYPVKSIKKIGSIFKGPWDRPVVKIFGEAITLNNHEHGIIRRQYDEPRIQP